MAPGSSIEKLTLSPSLESALEDVAFVQESVFEDMTLKIETLSLIDALASRLSRLTFETGPAHENCAKAGHPSGKAGWYRARAPLPGAARIAPEQY